ncbi:hypothetical protein ACEWY4_006343 [Coilia grayii]|uniref:PARP catalytic domain-containing protein n=1 Tax=Coilia grayii TaxID=363190 RepID=A0ABD1KD56_9TELE
MREPSEGTCPQHGTKAESNEGAYTMYHGTSLSAARQILRFGFRPSKLGKLGKGVYLTCNFRKAAFHADVPNRQGQAVILQLRVRIGKAVKTDQLCHPLRMKWHQAGYDSAWIPANPLTLESEEHCIWDPRRITVLSIMIPPFMQPPTEPDK